MIARIELAVLTLDPVPEAARTFSINEDQQILMMVLGDFLVDGGAGLAVGDSLVTIHGFDLKNDHASKLSDFAPEVVLLVHGQL